VTSSNAVTFFGIPLQQPGNSNGIDAIPPDPGARTFRITNLRSNLALQFGNTGPLPIPISATLSSTGAPLPLLYTTLAAGFVLKGLNYQTRNVSNTLPLPVVDLSGCVAGSPCHAGTARFGENFATAFKAARQLNPQNVPGFIYQGESGFFDPAWTATSSYFANVGFADFGIRLKATFQGIPAGVQLWVPTILGAATLTATETGDFSPVATGQTIDGIPMAQLSVSNGSAKAIWEITTSNPLVLDTLDFPVWVVFPAFSTPSGALTINGLFAP